MVFWAHFRFISYYFNNKLAIFRVFSCIYVIFHSNIYCNNIDLNSDGER